MNHTSPVAVISHVSKSYRAGPNPVHALRDVSMVTYSGELVAAAGPSGSGKTTLHCVRDLTSTEGGRFAVTLTDARGSRLFASRSGVRVLRERLKL